jgi:hypothetical protein
VRAPLVAVFALAASAAPLACHSSRAPGAPGESGAGESGWYDADALLVSVRPSFRADAAKLAGVRRLEDLPLYDLDLSIDLERHAFTLGEELWFTNPEKAPLSEIVLRIYANVVSTKKDGSAPGSPVRFVSGACVSSGACSVTAEGPSTLTVRPATPLAPGARLRVTLKLDGDLEVIDGSRTTFLAQGIEGMSMFSGGGEGAGDYGLLAIGDGIASFGNFYPVLARRKDGTWERGEKSRLGDLGSDDLAHVRARIELPANATLATSGVVVADERVAGTGPPRHRVQVAAGMVRDFAVFAGSGLQVSTQKVGDVEVRSFYLAPEKGAGMQVLDVAVHALADFEQRFGAYPYVDFDVVEAAIVGGAGGVEFSGVVTAASMLYRPVDAGDGPLAGLMKLAGGGAALGKMTDSMLEFVVAHETAHQWWHGLVGSDSRDHPFVDEGLAQYSAILYLEDRYGKERAQQGGDMNAKMNYQSMRFLGTPDGPVDRPVEEFGSALAYGGLIYGKGPYFYKALRRKIGDDAFFALVREYVDTYRFKLAPGRGLADLAATGPNGVKAKEVAAHWLDEAHGDADLGQLDLNSLVGGMLGGAGVGGVDMQSITQLLNTATGTDGGAGATKGGKKQPDPNEMLERMMKQLGGP